MPNYKTPVTILDRSAEQVGAEIGKAISGTRSLLPHSWHENYNRLAVGCVTELAASFIKSTFGNKAPDVALATFQKVETMLGDDPKHTNRITFFKKQLNEKIMIPAGREL